MRSVSGGKWIVHSDLYKFTLIFHAAVVVSGVWIKAKIMFL